MPVCAIERLKPVSKKLWEYTEKLIQKYQKQGNLPQGCLLRKFLDAIGTVFTYDQVIATTSGLLFAGQESTRLLIGNMMYLLLTHPDQMEKLRKDNSLIFGSVEEALRLWGPTRALARLTSQEISVEGHSVPQNELVYLDIRGAN